MWQTADKLRKNQCIMIEFASTLLKETLMLNPDTLPQTDFSESRKRLITYLKDTYTNFDSNKFNVKVCKHLQTLFIDKENQDYQLLKTCAVSGDPKLLIAFMKLIALAYLPAAKDTISSGTVTFHEAGGNNSNKDWFEYSASNIYRPALNLIQQTVSKADSFRISLTETSIPFINCSISVTTTIEKLAKLFTELLNKITPDKVIDELLLSIDPTYQPQITNAEIRINMPLNR